MNTCFPPLDDGCPSSPSAPPPLTDHSLPSTATHALDNPRHEAFAFALAAGESVAGAYDAAGFHPKNRKARSEALSQQPDIVAPVKHLVETVPNLIDLWRSHAPSFGTMPETPRKMNAWLWQVLTGRRKVQPLQMQAARLFVRMNHWDRRPKKGEDAPTAPPLVLVSGPVAQSLDLINAVNLAHEVHFNLGSPLESEYESDVENGVRPSPGGPQEDSTIADGPYRWDPLDLINGPHVIPMWTNGDRNPHSQSIDPQASNLETSKNADEKIDAPSAKDEAADHKPLPSSQALNLDSSPPTDSTLPRFNPSTMPPSPQTITNNSNPLPTTANGGAAAPKKLTYLQELVLGLHNGPPRTAALAGDSQFNLATLVLPV